MKIVEIRARSMTLAFRESYHWAGRKDLGAAKAEIEHILKAHRRI